MVVYASILANMNPPLCACLIAMTIGLIPFLKRCLYDMDYSVVAPVIVQSGLIVGACSIPSVLLILGSRLSKGPVDIYHEAPRFLLPAIILMKLVFIPIILFLTVFFMRKVNWISMDPCLALILLLCDIGPTAINLLVIASTQGCYESTLTTLNFYAYITCNITTTFWVACFLWILSL